MAEAPAVTSAQVRAYRILTSGLDRTTTEVRKLPLWELGMQDRDGSTALVMAARLSDPAAIPELPDPGAHSWTALVWSLRGSPHLHRRVDLERIATALWPADALDAKARLSGDAGRLEAGGAEPLEAFGVVADVMREVITAPMVKGAASAAVTAALPSRFSGFCQGCNSVHVRELLFRLGALPAGLGLVPGTKPVVLAPLSVPPSRPEAQHGLAALAAECYRQFGVAAPGDIGVHLGTSATCIRPALPEDLVQVTVDGVKTQAPESLLAEIIGADPSAAAEIIRLLPPSDPVLQPRDRAVLTTDPAKRKELWPAMGSPGAVLAGGGLAGTWRTRASGATLTITVTAWRNLKAAEKTALDDEAQLVGHLRQAKRTTLVYA